MEYCENIVGSSVSRKKMAGIFGAVTIAVVLVGMAFEISKLELKSGNSANKELRRVSCAQSGLRPVVAVGTIGIPDRILEESIVRRSRKAGMVSRISPSVRHKGALMDLSDPAGRGIDEIIVKTTIINSVTDFPEVYDVSESMDGDIVTEAPSDNIILNPPEEEIKPDTPEEGIPAEPTVPSVPDVPQEDIVPDTPEEEVLPDIPSDGDIGSSDVTPGFEVNEDGMIYSFLPEQAAVEEGGYLALPQEGCGGLLSGVFSGVGTGIYDIYIPANITYIEENAFQGLDELYGIDVEEGNPNYASDGGVMFDKGKAVLLAFPKARIGTYGVPQGVTALADYSFAGAGVSKLDMRACGLVEVGGAVFGESDGNGIVIMAPHAYLAEYQEIFAGYNVTVQ